MKKGAAGRIKATRRAAAARPDRSHLPLRNIWLPFVALAILLAASVQPHNWLWSLTALGGLIAAVLVAVDHAEVVALRVGEPFGTMILAVAITVIEVALIVTIMISSESDTRSLVRDTVFATVMIICNGGIALCLFIGTLRHFVLAFRVEGSSPALSVLITLTTLTLILPTLTTTTAGPTFSRAQLIFAGIVSLALYAMFVFVQTVRHRDYFLPLEVESERRHAAPPSTRVAWTSLGLLCVALIAVVGLAKSIAPALQKLVSAAAAPPPVVGVLIALLVLMPESLAALRAALRNRMQTSLNLLLGSALATIGLTIPSVVALSLMLGLPLELGLPPKETALLALTFLISAITLAGGQATVLHGAVHLVLFATFLFLSVVP